MCGNNKELLWVMLILCIVCCSPRKRANNENLCGEIFTESFDLKYNVDCKVEIPSVVYSENCIILERKAYTVSYNTVMSLRL